MIAEQKLTVLSTGQRIALSLFDVSDMPLFIDISMSKQMMKHVYAPLTQQAATEAFVERSQPWTLQSDHWLSLGINDIFSGEKLGSIGLKIVNHSAKIAEVGFMIKTSAQGKGYASEALSLLMHYAYNTLNLNKLVATCSINNSDSFNLLEKHGFIREGCLRQNTLINNILVDDYVYGLCKPTNNK